MSQISKDQDPQYWRGFGQLFQTDGYKESLEREFEEGATTLTDPISRRSFISLMGATAAFAGLTGCNIRRPVQNILPYAKMPEHVLPGIPLYYATAMGVGEDVVGLLVESHEGRPTKIEGNPQHSQSLGAASAIHQASILELYDPDRLKEVKSANKGSTVQAFKQWWDSKSESYKNNRGKGLAICTEHKASPSYYKILREFKRSYPLARIYRYEPINRDNIIDGLNLVTEEWLNQTYDFSEPDIIVSIGSDFLNSGPGSLRYTKQFVSRRNPDQKMNRLYVFESTFSVTGTKADHRVPIKSSDMALLLWKLMRRLLQKAPERFSGLLTKEVMSKMTTVVRKLDDPIDDIYIKVLADELLQNPSKSLIVAGAEQSPTVHGLIALLNIGLENVNRSVFFRDLNFSNYSIIRKNSRHSIKALAEDIQGDRIETLIMVGGDLLYNSPVDLDFRTLIDKVDDKVHLSLFENQTNKMSDWRIPRKHYLEAWEDLQSIDGSVSIQQPLIRPLYEGFSDSEFIRALIGDAKALPDDDYSLLITALESRYSAKIVKSKFSKWINTGLVTGPTKSKSVINIKNTTFSAAILEKIKAYRNSHAQLEMVLYPDRSLYDGRFANNGWLQEFPDPITKLTWDNAALIAPKTASKLGIQWNGETGHTASVYQFDTGVASLQLPVLVLPGQAENSIGVSLGYGQSDIGRVGRSVGGNAFSLFSSREGRVISDVQVNPTEKSYQLASTQEHHSLEGRPHIREATYSDYEKHPHFAQEMVEHPPLESIWDEKEYTEGYQWGMSIDLNKCTGCGACTLACQSENNIPIVGKDEVLNGREMSWIRIDRYFQGDVDKPRMVQQPMTCIQCEMAPCEQVCPVAATVHDSEGLNAMTYNRCIGTRYCANNCPVKVRRFNFFDYHQRNPQSVKKVRQHLFDYIREPDPSIQKQFNPDVSIRMRGVMEKCTYCVQRISEAKHTSKNENRLVLDGEIKPACAQTCAADAIVFGNILDKKSQVAKEKLSPRNYTVLEELNLKPRTSYLAGITNPQHDIYAFEKQHQHDLVKGHH